MDHQVMHAQEAVVAAQHFIDLLPQLLVRISTQQTVKVSIHVDTALSTTSATVRLSSR